jgi:sugar transferase (PEP-CTERM system associated)
MHLFLFKNIYSFGIIGKYLGWIKPNCAGKPMISSKSRLKKSALFFTFDTLSLIFAFLCANKLSTILSWGQYTDTESLVTVSITAALMSISHLSVGLHETKLRENFRGMLRRCILSFGLIFLAFQVAASILNIEVHNITLIGALVFCSTLQSYWRYWAINQGHFYITRKRILFLGAGERASFLPRRMRRHMDRKHISIMGFLPIMHTGADIHASEKVINLSGDETLEERLHFLAEQDAVDVVVIASDKDEGLPTESLLELKMGGVEIVELEDFVESELGQLAVEHMRPEWLLKSDGFNFNRILFNRLNYIFNAGIALSMLLFVWPFMLAAIIAIYLDDGKRDKAGLLYRQQRVGAGGLPFEIMKFRSMGKNAESNGPQWATSDDMRVTTVGKYLRKYRIDELPQLINVLRGDMYFVGPRPERPEFVEELKKEIPFFSYRHCVKPGLTGWAQINYPYGASTKDSLEKLKFDLYYIKHHSFLLDIFVLIRTVEIILFGKGR